ncbi:membrane protein [Streptosporangium fragile]|uniref:Membrane protein n=1 Tax=Streptosporangium fragile TaxID=46186 RepID=A0ABP6IQI7_9ACTN
MSSERVTGWVGWIWFAGMMMILNGIFNSINGLTAIFNDRFFLEARGRVLVFDLTGWGWVHLTVGILLIVVGAALATGRLWARIVGIALVMINAVAQMASVWAYPWWSLLALVVDGLVLYALIVHGREAEALRL